MRLQIACCILVFFGSCSGPTTKEEQLPEPVWFKTDTVLIWNCDAATETKVRIYETRDSVPIPEPVVNGINRVWPEVILYVGSVQKDTLEVFVRNSDWLTGLSGSHGAEQYLTFAALNLLEVKGVHYVRFQFPEGSHAKPGVWSQRDFIDWKQTASPK